MTGDLEGVPARFYEIRDVDGEKLIEWRWPPGPMTVAELRALIRHLTQVADTADQMAAREITR